MGCPPAGSITVCGEGSEKEQWPVPALLSVGKLPPALALMLDYSVPSHMSLMPFSLLPLHWSSEEASLSKSVCGCFKRNCQGVQQFLSFTASIPTGFCSQKLG